MVADGVQLPFEDRSFDAVSHSDVLCCLPEKLLLLQTCRRVARAGAKMMFSVIVPTAGLSEAEHRTAIESGPPFVEVHGDYAALLGQSGWRVMKQMDETSEFARSIRASLEGMHARADALAEAFGRDEFCGRLQHRQATVAAVDRGLLKREIFVAVAA